MKETGLLPSRGSAFNERSVYESICYWHCMAKKGTLAVCGLQWFLLVLRETACAFSVYQTIYALFMVSKLWFSLIGW